MSGQGASADHPARRGGHGPGAAPAGAPGRVCVFCGGTPLTAEHIWPDWARRMLPGAPIGDFTFRAQTPAGTAEPRTSRERVFNQRARVVCQRCNNGWMSDLEGENRPLLEAALHGRGSELHRGRQRALAAWAHKTAIVINAGLFRAHRTGMAPEHAHYLREHGQPPDDVGIWVTSVTAEEPAWVSSNGLALSTPGQRVSDEDPPNFSIVTFAFGPLAFQIASAVDPAATGVIPAEITFTWPVIHRVWPYRGSFTWSRNPCLDQPHLEVFATRIQTELQRLVGS